MPTKTPVNRCVRPKERAVVRYATYVHSDIDGGGVVDLNYIQMQRKAIADYVASKAPDGELKEYEDIGQQWYPFKRPALKRLMAETAGG